MNAAVVMNSIAVLAEIVAGDAAAQFLLVELPGEGIGACQLLAIKVLQLQQPLFTQLPLVLQEVF